MAKWKALLVGAGGMGRHWGKTLQECEETELVGWVDIADGVAAKAAQKLELADTFIGTDLKDAIRRTRPDFVVDVTVPEAHHDVTLAALDAGLPVLGEKPMADAMERARAMVAASERAKTLYMVSQSRRYNNGLRALRRLAEASLGEIGIINTDFYIGAHFGGFREQMASPLLVDMAIHTFDAVRYVSGADAIEVYCEEYNPRFSWFRGNACATAVFEMTGGIRYTYRGSWCAEGAATSWESEWRVVGQNGSAKWDGQTTPVADLVTKRGEFISKTEQVRGDLPPLLEGIAGSLRDFLTALESGTTPMGECHDNLKSLAMVFAALQSARTGTRVRVDV